MFKFKSYNVKKISEKNEKEGAKSSSSSSSSFSSSTGTLKKPSSSERTKSSSSSSSKTKKKASPEEIKAVNNKQSPEYSKKIYPKKDCNRMAQKYNIFS